jgi:8-oxo-dGTP pyrophosphatase MutT (NUDIX family)
MASVIIILECVDFRKHSIPCLVLYEEHKWGEGKVYSSPGGSRDKGESFIDAAIRETKEETFLDVPRRLLKTGEIVVGTTHFWVVKLEDIKREEYIKARFCSDNLKKYQKETHDLTKVPISILKRAIELKSRYVLDLGGRWVKLRRSFYNCLVNDSRLIKRINLVDSKCPCS